MDKETFRKHAHEMVDWICDYYEHLSDFPVKSQVAPREIFNQLPSNIPNIGEDFQAIWKDFEAIILPGMTHWQHPHFHAYFNANTSFPSLLGEMAMSAMGAQCMIWDTSPAAAELEEKVLDWMKLAMGLPSHWSAVIQDTASTATLSAIISAREKKSDYQINQNGFGQEQFKLYCSEEAHSSVEKAAKIAGLGKSAVEKIPTDHSLAMNTKDLQSRIRQNIEQGYIPLMVVAAMGSTSTLAVDPIQDIGQVCEQHDCWFHIDAAYLGSVLFLPEYQHLTNGIALADSLVYNPHKWLFTNFDCTTYFVKDKDNLIKTFEILPEYLKTNSRGHVNDYRDWGIPLGRRFRALKLWFVLRTFGLEGIQSTIRNHIEWTQSLSETIDQHEDFELLIPTHYNLIVFRYIKAAESADFDSLNKQLLDRINESGEAFLTHTKVRGRYAIRVAFGQTYQTEKQVQDAWSIITRHAELLETGN